MSLFTFLFIKYSSFKNRVCKQYTAVELFVQQNSGWFRKYKGMPGHRAVRLGSYVRRPEVVQIILPQWQLAQRWVLTGGIGRCLPFVKQYSPLWHLRSS